MASHTATAVTQKVALNVTDAVYERLKELADERGASVTEVFRRALSAFDSLDRLEGMYPSGHVEFVIPASDASPAQSFPILLPTRKSAIV